MQARIVVGWALGTLALLGCEKQGAERNAPQAEPQATERTAAADPGREPSAAYELDSHESPKAAGGAADTPAKSPTPAADAPANKGPSVTGEGFEAHLAAPEVTVGKAATAQVVLNAVAPFHCNDKYPYKFTLDPTPGISYPETTLKGMQIGENRSTMSVPFTATEAGKKTLSGELSFSVCTDDKCLIEKQKLTATLDVKGAS